MLNIFILKYLPTNVILSIKVVVINQPVRTNCFNN